MFDISFTFFKRLGNRLFFERKLIFKSPEGSADYTGGRSLSRSGEKAKSNRPLDAKNPYEDENTKETAKITREEMRKLEKKLEQAKERGVSFKINSFETFSDFGRLLYPNNASKAERTAADLRTGLEDSLDNWDRSINGENSLWEDLIKLSCAKVTIHRNVFHFYRADGTEITELFPGGAAGIPMDTDVQERILGGNQTGSLRFKNPEAGERYTVIDDLYKAQNVDVGDEVVIKRAVGGKPRVAVFDKSGHWIYKDRPKEVVKIYENDKLEYRAKAVDAPKNIKTLGYVKRPDRLTISEWKSIAADAMKTKFSPAHGYSAENSEDVDTYAIFLREQNKKTDIFNRKYIWLVDPPVKGSVDKDAKTSEEKEAERRGKITTSFQPELQQEEHERGVVRNRNFDRVLENEDYDVQDDLDELVQREGLKPMFDEAWDNNRISEKAKIEKGLVLLGIDADSMSMVARDFVFYALHENRAWGSEISLETLLDVAASDRFKDKIVLYRNPKREIGDYDDFRNEYSYRRIAKQIGDNITAGKTRFDGINGDEQDFYEEQVEKWEEENVPEINRGDRYNELLQKITGAAYVLEGVAGSHVTESFDSLYDTNEKRREGEKTWEGVSESSLDNSEEAVFLRKIADERAGNGSLADIPEARQANELRSRFHETSSEAALNTRVTFLAKNNGDWNRDILTNELNTYIRSALDTYVTLDEQAAQGKDVLGEKERLKKLYGLDGYSETRDKVNFVNTVMADYTISSDLQISSDKFSSIRAMIHDGFASYSKAEGSNVRDAEKIQEYKSFVSHLPEGPARNAIITYLAEHPEITYTDAEMQKLGTEIQAAFEQDTLLNGDVGVDTVNGRISLGVSKPIQLKGGWTLQVGGGVGIPYGESQEVDVYAAVSIGKNIDLTPQLKASIEAAVGVTPGAVPELFAGAQGGITWLSKGSADSAWRAEIRGGIGLGASINPLTRVNFGPHVSFGVGARKDIQNEYNLGVEQAYMKSGYDRVEAASDPKEKLTALFTLPNGVGEFLFDLKMQGRSNEQILAHYENELKPALRRMVLEQAQEDAPGLSRIAIGADFSPPELALLTYAVSTGNAALAVFLAARNSVQIEFITSAEIVLKQDVSSLTDAKKKAYEELAHILMKQNPGKTVRIMDAQEFRNEDRVGAKKFVGDYLQKFVEDKENLGKADTEIDDFQTPEGSNFEELQEQFAKHHLELGVAELEPGKMGTYIRPTEIARGFRLWLDPQMQAGRRAVWKGDRLFLSDIGNLDISRIDIFAPREPVQQTFIVIGDSNRAYDNSDQQAAKYMRNPDTIAEASDYYIEASYDRTAGRVLPAKRTMNTTKIYGSGEQPKQNNLHTFEELAQYNQRDGKDYFQVFYDTGAKVEIGRHHQELSNRAQNILQGRELNPDISLDGVTLRPDQFEKRFPKEYRKFTTSVARSSVEQLKSLDAFIDQNVKNADGSPLTEDQKILFKDRLYNESMSEGKIKNRKLLFENRLHWAEPMMKNFFAEKLASTSLPKSPDVTAQSLTAMYIRDLRKNFNPASVAEQAIPGDSISTVVGTYKIEGKRNLAGVSGQAEEVKFLPAVDYSQYLRPLDNPDADTKQREYIARLMVEHHDEIPADSQKFLNSRIAQELMFMGVKDKVANPFIGVIGENQYEALCKAYEALNQNAPLPADADVQQAIEKFKNIAAQLRDAQFGKGIPVNLDGHQVAGVNINGFYLVIDTSIRTGAYDTCTNPSDLYRQNIWIYRPEQIQKALRNQPVVAGAAKVLTLSSRESMNITSFGLRGSVNYQFTPGEEPSNEGPVAGQGGKVDQEVKNTTDTKDVTTGTNSTIGTGQKNSTPRWYNQPKSPVSPSNENDAP